MFRVRHKPVARKQVSQASGFAATHGVGLACQ